MSRTVLVTGGAGFIGSHIVDRLIQSGFTTIVFDNESTGNRANVNADAVFVHGDVRHEEELAQVFEEHHIDAVLHIAGQASIRLSFMDPTEDLNTNTTGTIHILNQCIKHGVSRLLFASSMTIYGTPEVVPTPETAFPMPLSYYAVTKYAAERYVHITSDRKDLASPLNVTSFRMFNVYGPRQSLTNSYQGVFAIFMGNILRNETINIHSDGEQSRDFVHISDVARAWVDAIDNPSTYGQVINLGTGKPVSINHLCDLVLENFGKTRQNYPVNYYPAQVGDIRISAADITRARNLMGWTPQVTQDNGFRETIKWARTRFESR
jgi:UDP-glucose 4-epimerase